MKLMTWDLFISYWIFAWFIVYYVAIQFKLSNEYIIQNFNPKFGLLLGLIENIIFFLSFLTQNVMVAFKYLIVIIIYKIIPLYLLRKYPMNLPNDVYILLLLCIVFKFYLYYKGYPSVVKLYKQSNADILNGKSTTPMFAGFAYLESLFSRKSS